MAKQNTTLKFTNACIERDEETGDFIISETTKDEVKVYNLTEKIEEFLNIEGVSLQMAKVTEIKPDMD